jgi:multidrug efflux pump subunit AcrB
VFEYLLAGYRASLDHALRHRAMTLAIFVLTVGLSGYLFAIIPKGFFPQQDTGLLIGTSEADAK